MAELSTIEFSDFVKLARVLWTKGAKSVTQYMMDSGLVKVMDIPSNSGNTREFSEIDRNEYASYKGEGDQATRAQVQQGYSNTMTKYRIGENIGVTWEMRHENKYPEVINALVGDGTTCAKRIDLDLSHRLTFMTATSFTDRDGRTQTTTVGDGLALLSTVHTLTGSTTTFRNRLANNPKLSKSALEGMERLIVENTYNHLGEKKTMDFDILWTTEDPNTVNTAREYLQSTADVTGSHEGIINVYRGKYTHKVLPRVATDANGAPDTDKRYYWGIASSANSSFYLGMWERPHMIPPTVGSNAEDVQTDDWDFRSRAGLGIVTVGAAWIKGSTGDDAA
jgi:hypothetical protein